MTERKDRPCEGFYREAPFWSWNDVLEVDEALRQMDLMKAGGWGGFFMHARTGLVTPYMREQWMKVTKACVEHAKETGMCAYLYDENRWPSGFAGGEVARKSPQYRTKWMVMSQNLPEPDDGRYKYVASFVVEGGKSPKARRVSRDEKPSGGRTVYHFSQFTSGLGNDWFFGASYVDLMDPDTTDEFIRLTHEPYRALVGEDFGRTVPGIFTDEPCISSSDWGPGSCIPWTTRMAEEFRARRGYDVIDHLVSLFLPVGNYRKRRYDFWRTVTELFVRNYMKRIYDWCQKYDLPYTGHLMAEDSISYQITWVGAAMPSYEYMHYPGMDHLCFNVDNPLTAKQVSSVADQLGKPRALSELYGVSGQDFNFKGRRWIADWHLALGINLLNPHLWLYTMRGERKRDFPPTISYQQSHWLKSTAMSDHNASLSKILSSGRRIVDVLVLHPVETGWTEYSPIDRSKLDPLDKSFAAAIDALLAAHLDFHLGDETLMAKYGGIEDGKLAVGSGRYSVVVVPFCATLRLETLRLLLRFAAEGGSIVVLGDKPHLVEAASVGRKALDKAFRKAVSTDLKGLASAVRQASAPRVAIAGRNAGKVIYHFREIEGRHVLFLANTDYDKGASVRVTAKAAPQHAGVVNLSGGDPNLSNLPATALPSRRSGDGCAFSIDLADADSVCIAFADSPFSAAAQPVLPAGGRKVKLADSWRVKDMDENALTIDYVRVADSNRGWTRPQYVLFASEDLKLEGGEAHVRYDFDVEVLPRGPVHFVMERPEKWTIFVNGAPVLSKDAGSFVDTTFRRIDITAAVRLGTNTVELRGPVTDDFELESAYVVGRFGVWRKGAARPGVKLTDQAAALPDLAGVGRRFVIGAVPATVTAGDLGEQGFRFFCGTVTLEQDVTLKAAPARAALTATGLLAGAAEVRVNGRACPDLIWPPYETALKGLKSGRNKVSMKLFATLRNLLGPHHWDDGDPRWCGPGSFSDRKHWTDEYSFHPFGIEGLALVVK